MTQQEFIELSKSETKNLNAGYGKVDQHSESWRGGYEFARRYILNLLTEKHQDEFIAEVEEFATQDLDIFDS